MIKKYYTKCIFQVPTEQTYQFIAVWCLKTDRLNNNTWHILVEIKNIRILPGIPHICHTFCNLMNVAIILVILYYALLNLEMFCEVCFRATAGVVTCSKAAGGCLFLLLFLGQQRLEHLGTGTLELSLGRNKMQQILRDLQEHGLRSSRGEKDGRTEERQKRKRAGNPCEFKKAHSMNKAKTELHKRISAFNQSTAVKRSAYTFYWTFLLIALWWHAQTTAANTNL